MEIPRHLRKQIDAYKRAGFNVIDIEFRAGAHAKLWFAEFPEPQFVTKNADEPRALKNNIARYKRLAAVHKEKQ
jgi:hypothetical protein